MFKFSTVGSVIWSQKLTPKLMARVILVEQIVELGEASPKEALTKPDEKPNEFEKKPPTRGCPLLLSMGFTQERLKTFFFVYSTGISSQSSF